MAGLSRLMSAADKRAVKQGLADGSIGVVVGTGTGTGTGTGAVAGIGVAYKDLALVVIDEEQRFGAADKTRLREMGRAMCSPCRPRRSRARCRPRWSGCNSCRSSRSRPPARRQPIPHQRRRVRSRDGAHRVAARAQPRRAEFYGCAAEDIDTAMVRFGDGDGDVLFATNIIEAGLDVPRANTMLAWRADRFGLSQLHQLRGRVGRGGRRGQVILLTDPDTQIAPRTLARLRTLQTFDRLGAGFAISARDLDMRGAGDLLGDEQAGHMKLIGIDLYQHLLESALRAARGEDVERWTPELNLGLEGCFPAGWIPDEELRVTLYARLARIDDQPGLDPFADELADRFGELPAQAETLLTLTHLRLLARAAAIGRIDAGPAAIALTVRAGFKGDAAAAGLEEKDGRLILKERIEDAEARLGKVEELLHEL